MISTITTLRSVNNEPATKLIRPDANGKLRTTDYGKSKYFHVGIESIGDIFELSGLLKGLEDNASTMIVRGGLKPDVDLSRPVRRRMRGNEQDVNESPFEDIEQPWMMLDFDTVEATPTTDLVNDPESAIRHVIKMLPMEFQDVTCHWQLSSSAGIKSGIRIHLWYWLTKPMTCYDLKQQWAVKFNQQEGSKLIDPALFQAVQPHYTAKPVFVGGAVDPLTRRSGLLEGSRPAVELNLDFPQAASSDSLSPVSRQLTSSAGGFHNILDYIGDDRDGFNRPLSRAASSYVREHGKDKTEANTEALVEVFREAINNADQSNHTAEGIAGYLSDTYLNGIITSAIDKYGNKMKLEPYYTVDELDIDAASALLREKVEKWSYLVHDYNKALNSNAALPPRPVIGIKAAAGVGKTTSILRSCFNIGVFSGHVEYYVPSHALSSQLQKDIEEDVGEPFRKAAKGIKLKDSEIAKVIKGRDSEGYCHKVDEVKQVMKAGLSVASVLCGDATSGHCEFYNECLYQKQFNYKDRFESWEDGLALDEGRGSVPTVSVMAHNHLFLHTRDRLPKPEMIIVDESFFQHGIEEISVPTSEIIAGGNATLRLINDALMYREPLLKQLRDKDISPTALREIADQLPHKGRTIDISPTMPLAQQRAALSRVRAPSKLPELLNWLADELDWHTRDVSHIVTLDKQRDSWVAHRRKRINVPEDVPILFIDANLDKDILQLFFDTPVSTVDIAAKRVATVYQFKDKTFSTADLVSNDGSDVLLDQVSRFIQTVATGTKTLVATTMKIRQQMTGETAEEVKSTGDFNGAKIVHFSKLRGLNDFEHYDNVIIVGRNQPPVEGLEDMASALFYEDEKPIDFISHEGSFQFLKSGRRGYRMTTGEEDTAIQYHPDHRVQKILEQIREAESGQAIDRLRPVRRTEQTKPNVYVLSNLPLDLTVDHAVSWKDFQKIQVVLTEAGGILPLHAADLHKVAPLAIGSIRTAKTMMKQYKGAESLIPCFVPEGCSMYEYKTERQRGKGYTVYVSKTLTISKEWLSKVLAREVVLLNQLN